jgi:Multiubiquitin
MEKTMENHEPKHHHVRIHIDERPYESPNPTTGEALYKLGNAQPGYDLFREVRGDREDPIVENDSEPVHLREDEHFHSGPAQPRKFTIIVNGQKKVVTARIVTFDEIVKLAFPMPPTGQNILYTVSYEDGPRRNPQGSLKEGQNVEVKNGMIFNVTATDKS